MDRQGNPDVEIAPPLVTRTNPHHRRNGKLQSCEPCRKSKLRCDHIMPTCGRCSQRKKSDQCTYHPAPLTRKPGYKFISKSTKSTAAVQLTTSAIGNKSDASQGATDTPASLPPQQPGVIAPPTPSRSTASTGLSEDRRTSNNPSYHFSGNPGYMGITSFSSIFAENQASLGIDNAEPSPDIYQDLGCSHIIEIDKVKQGAEILSLLTHLPAYSGFISRWFNISQGLLVIEPMVEQWSQELWRCHGSTLSERKPEQLQGLSELVWKNTHCSLNFNGKTTAQEWTSMSTGSQLRWEVVGIFCALVGLMSATVPQSDSVFEVLKDLGTDRATFCRRMHEAADLCQQFCNECGVLHDLYAWLLYENFCLTESIRGAADFSVWNRSGEFFNTVLALGLHQNIKSDADTPFFLAELRKKTFLLAFALDKSVSSLLGRPPRLLSRYCMIQLPLDLNEKQMYTEGAELENAIADLDEQGWNKKGWIRRITWGRVWLLNALVREEILDLSLCLKEEDVQSRAEAITQRAQIQYDSLPEKIRQPIEMSQRLRRSPLEQLCNFFTRLQYLTNHLLIQRVLISKTGADNKKLVEIARQIFKEVVTAAVKRDLLREYQVDFADLLACNGLRSAGILAVELLKQEHHLTHEQSDFPRSETIQNLSVFVSCLASIDPSDGTYAVCEQGRKILKRVLDKILSPRPAITPPTAAALLLEKTSSSYTLLAGANPLDASLTTNYPTTDIDLMQWLDNMEWERGSFMNFG